MSACGCGGSQCKKSHERAGTVVVVYLECEGCGLVFIESDTTGLAVVKALKKNSEILRHRKSCSVVGLSEVIT